jgi:hypothetical protein
MFRALLIDASLERVDEIVLSEARPLLLQIEDFIGAPITLGFEFLNGDELWVDRKVPDINDDAFYSVKHSPVFVGRGMIVGKKCHAKSSPYGVRFISHQEFIEKREESILRVQRSIWRILNGGAK